MDNLTFKNIKNLGFQIDEDIHNVAQFYKINLDSDTQINQFSKNNIESDIIETNYEMADTTFSISKGRNVIDTGLNEEEVIDFFASGEYKNY